LNGDIRGVGKFVGEKLWTVHKEVAELIKGHLLNDHGLWNDLKVSSFSW
jgi:hypothetical protein